MHALRGRFHTARPWAPTAAVLVMAGAIACLAGSGQLPGPDYGAAAASQRDMLLSYLPDADGVSYARNVLYLYSDGMPLLVVWVEDDPAELYDAEGRFVATLDFQELSRVIRRAGALMQHDPRWTGSTDAGRRDRA